MTEAATPAAPEPVAPRSLSRKRRAGIWALIVLGFVLALVSLFAIWVKRVALDTNTFVDTNSQVLESKNVQVALSTFLVDQLYANVDVEGRLKQRLPDGTKALAAPIAGGVREFSYRAANRALASDRVQQAVRQASRRTHEQAIELLDDKSKFVSTTGGTVTLDLRPVVITLADQIGLGQRLQQSLPADAGQLEIMRSDQLAAGQTLTRVLRVLADWLWLVALAAWAAALFLARGRRRQTLRAIAVSAFLLGVLVLVIRRVGGNVIVDSLVHNVANRPAVHDVWTIYTRQLAYSAQTLIIIAIFALLGTWLAGAGRRATAVRRWLAPYMRERIATVYGICATVYLVLILWAPTAAFRRPSALLVMAILAVIGIEALRRKARRDFPDAPYVPLGGAWRARGGSDEPNNPSSAVDVEAQRLERLERLSTLRQQGALTEEEFASEKAALLRQP
jgi:hypothetical protein